MKEKLYTNENPHLENEAFTLSEKDVLSLAEQDRLIRGSYCHQYGILIRLALFTGLRTPELLGLQWDDLDENNSGLHIRHQSSYGCSGSRLFIAPTFPRFVPIPAPLFKELAEWYETQNSTIAMYNLTTHSNSVAATIKGYQIPPWLLEYYFKQILQFCGLTNYPLSALRNSFAVNSIAQGMDLETLGCILDEPNVSIIYSKYIFGSNNINGDYNTSNQNTQSQSNLDTTYPVIVRSLSNGLLQLYAPNFPQLTCSGPILAHGLIIMREKIEDELCNLSYLPTPVDLSDIHCESGECVIQLQVNV